MTEAAATAEPAGEGGEGEASGSEGAREPAKNVLPTGNEPGSRGEDDGGEGEDGKPKAKKESKAEPKPRYKVKRADKEEEFEGEELARRFSDDYEHEFKGPKGIPLKLRWPEIQRAVQQSEGALQRMREYREAQDRWEQEVGAYQKDPATLLSAKFKVDPLQWAVEYVARAVKEEEELATLQQQNPIAAKAKRDALAKETAKRELEMQTMHERRAAEQAERQRQSREALQQFGEAMKPHGIPTTPEIYAIARAKYDEHLQAGLKFGEDFTMRDIADLTRKEYTGRMHGYLDALDESGLHGFLGEERVKKIIAFVAKAQKDAEKAKTKDDGQRSSTSSNGKRKPMTEAELKRKYEYKGDLG